MSSQGNAAGDNKDGMIRSANQTEQNNFMFRPLRWPVIILLALLLGIPIVWLLIAKLAGASISSISDFSGLLAIVGGVMGAIFTVGGLVIALVAILTQLSLQDRTQRAIELATDEIRKDLETKYEQALLKATNEKIPEYARDILEAKYQQDLRPDLEQRVDKQIQAHIAFHDAQEAVEAYDWFRAEDRTLYTLWLYPVREAPGLLGVKMSDVLITYFEQTHLGTVFSSNQILVGNSMYPIPNQEWAIRWLEQSRANGVFRVRGALEGEVQAKLALMYGSRCQYKDYEKMLTVMQEALQQAEEWWKDRFREPGNLIMLVHGCKNEPDQRREVQHVGNLLDLSLPVSEEDVRSSVPSANRTINWLVMGRGREWIDGEIKPNFPISLGIDGHDEEGIRVARASCVIPQQGTNQSLNIPASGYLPADQLITELMRRFFFICPYERSGGGNLRRINL
jgi:hypothetical protein